MTTNNIPIFHAEHRREEKSHSVTYWRDGVASSWRHATMVTIEVWSAFGPDKINFPYPEKKRQSEELEQMLFKVYERGYEKAKADLRAFMGLNEHVK